MRLALALLLLCSCNGRLSSDDPKLTLPLNIKVILHLDDTFGVRSSILQSSLTNILPFYSPPGVEMKNNVSDIVFELKYETIDKSDSDFINRYEDMIKEQPKDQFGVHQITTKSINRFLESYNDYSPTVFVLPIIIVAGTKLSPHYIVPGTSLFLSTNSLISYAITY